MTPTKEQHELAYRLWHYEPPEKIAQALADEAEAAQARIDALETQLSQAKAELEIAWSDCHDGKCNACPKCCDAARAESESLRAEAARVREKALEEATRVASDFSMKPDRNLHPDVPWERMNKGAQFAAHSAAQSIALEIRALAPSPNPACPSGKESHDE